MFLESIKFYEHVEVLLKFEFLITGEYLASQMSVTYQLKLGHPILTCARTKPVTGQSITSMYKAI